MTVIQLIMSLPPRGPPPQPPDHSVENCTNKLHQSLLRFRTVKRLKIETAQKLKNLTKSNSAQGFSRFVSIIPLNKDDKTKDEIIKGLSRSCSQKQKLHAIFKSASKSIRPSPSNIEDRMTFEQKYLRQTQSVDELRSPSVISSSRASLMSSSRKNSIVQFLKRRDSLAPSNVTKLRKDIDEAQIKRLRKCSDQGLPNPLELVKSIESKLEINTEPVITPRQAKINFGFAFVQSFHNSRLEKTEKNLVRLRSSPETDVRTVEQKISQDVFSACLPGTSEYNELPAVDKARILLVYLYRKQPRRQQQMSKVINGNKLKVMGESLKKTLIECFKKKCEL